VEEIMERFRMLAKEIGPNKIVMGNTDCPGTTCPSVLLRSDGRAVVVGKKMGKTEVKELESTGKVKVYEDEFAVLVDPELLRGSIKELDK
jgi:hypothetical protein